VSGFIVIIAQKREKTKRDLKRDRCYHQASILDKNNWHRLFSILPARLDQIPQVPVQIFENSYRAIRLGFWLPDELDVSRKHLMVVAPEVIRAEKQGNPATGLVANERFLLRCRCA